MSERIETSTSTLQFAEDGILHCVFNTDVDESLASAKENVRAAAGLCEGRQVPLLIDMRTMKSITPEARNFYAGPEPATYSAAQALLIGSTFSRVIGNFFMRLHRVRFPTQLFTSEEQALQWLRRPEFAPRDAAMVPSSAS